MTGTPEPTATAGSASPDEFAGRIAVVTGGASGIGAATTALLRARGATVEVIDLPDTDVTDETAVIDRFADIVERHGRVDLAANCAGVNGRYGPITELDLEEWRRVIEINLTGVFLCLREELRHVAAAQAAATPTATTASIVNVSSGAGLRGFANLPHYVASKHGVIGLTRAAAAEWARRSVRINAVAPGTVRTPMLESFCGNDEAALAQMGRAAPMGRLGTPDEIAEAIVWLLSDAARFVTGSVVSADGGVSAV